MTASRLPKFGTYRLEVTRAFGAGLVLLAASIWGAVLYASLSGIVGARLSGAEAIAQAARLEAAVLLRERASAQSGRVQADAARLAAIAVEESGGAPDGAQLAEALGEADGPAGRKEAFIKIVLPLILAENARIQTERDRLLALKEAPDRASAADLMWLKAMAADFDLPDDVRTSGQIDALLAKVDIIPPSMALGQAAEESGWGASRPAQGQNALFGLQTMSIGGLISAPVPARDGRLKNASFEHLRQCVAAYMHTLNSHRAYAEFRAARAERRRMGKSLDGPVLVTHLTRYSELGMDYVRKIQSLIRRNRLDALDRAPKAAG